jgi:nuclear transport factor 2 (NTF2) superfamily protein
MTPVPEFAAMCGTDAPTCVRGLDGVCRLTRSCGSFTDHRIAVRFACEWRDDSGHWFRSYGNENWEFDAGGLMQRRFASINDMPIAVSDRKFHELVRGGLGSS